MSLEKCENEPARSVPARLGAKFKSGTARAPSCYDVRRPSPIRGELLSSNPLNPRKTEFPYRARPGEVRFRSPSSSCTGMEVEGGRETRLLAKYAIIVTSCRRRNERQKSIPRAVEPFRTFIRTCDSPYMG